MTNVVLALLILVAGTEGVAVANGDASLGRSGSASCASGQVRAVVTNVAPFHGEGITVLSLQLTGARPCSVKGWPRVTARTADGRAFTRQDDIEAVGYDDDADAGHLPYLLTRTQGAFMSVGQILGSPTGSQGCPAEAVAEYDLTLGDGALVKIPSPRYRTGLAYLCPQSPTMYVEPLGR